MAVRGRWVLPEGIEDVLPVDAQRVELLRRHLLDLYYTWGYDLVIPPLIEHLDSLFVGSGNDLETHTFKFIDNATGELVGVRSDITPQVARIDARRLKREGPTRLCYLGQVLLTQPRELGGSRSPIQVGAELYGHSGVESDLEIIKLMLESLLTAGCSPSNLDLGHVAIFRGLAKQANISKDQERQLIDILERKSQPELAELLQSVEQSAAKQMLVNLIDLHGDEHVLVEAKQCLKGADQSVQTALVELESLAAQVKKQRPDVAIHFDLAELRGYQYHTGVVFAAYAKGYWQAVAQGGRYDEVGAVFGRSRPATGFSLDLSVITNLVTDKPVVASAIYAPGNVDESLETVIASLRSKGERVVRELNGQSVDAKTLGCDRILTKQNNQWLVKKLENLHE